MTSSRRTLKRLLESGQQTHSLSGWRTQYGKHEPGTRTEDYQAWREREIARVRAHQAERAVRDRQALSDWLSRNGITVAGGPVDAAKLRHQLEPIVVDKRLAYRLRGVRALEHDLTTLGYQVTQSGDSGAPVWPVKLGDSVDTWFENAVVKRPFPCRGLPEMVASCARFVARQIGERFADRVTSHGLAKYLRARGVTLIRESGGMVCMCDIKVKRT